MFYEALAPGILQSETNILLPLFFYRCGWSKSETFTLLWVYRVDYGVQVGKSERPTLV